LVEELQGKAALGVPEEQLWREMGYDAKQITEMQKMKAKADKARANLGGELLREFDRNEGDGAEQEGRPRQAGQAEAITERE
jgi:hypothetical protein